MTLTPVQMYEIDFRTRERSHEVAPNEASAKLTPRLDWMYGKESQYGEAVDEFSRPYVLSVQRGHTSLLDSKRLQWLKRD